MAKTARTLVLLTLLGVELSLPAGAMVPRSRLIHEVDVPLELHAIKVRRARALLHDVGFQLFTPGELPSDGTHRGSVLCDGTKVVYPRTPSPAARAFCQSHLN